ncbi:hypothetical protein ABPG77_006316 [Micractinium sp. CCAP 211/92]
MAARLAVQPDLLARLDDSSDAVRVAASATLLAWLACLLAPAGSGPSLAKADVLALASSMLIHMDDADAEVADAVSGTLCTLASAQPAAVCPLALAATAVHWQRPDLLGKVLAACEAGGCYV